MYIMDFGNYMLKLDFGQRILCPQITLEAGHFQIAWLYNVFDLLSAFITGSGNWNSSSMQIGFCWQCISYGSP